MVEADRRESYEDSRDGESASVSWVARIASGIGLVLFLGSVGILGYEGLFRSGGDPVIALSVESVTHDGQRWLARVRAENTGGETGAQVRIAGQLMDGPAVVERAEAEFTYVPAGSTQEGGLFFERDPRAHDLRLRVLGYAKP